MLRLRALPGGFPEGIGAGQMRCHLVLWVLWRASHVEQQQGGKTHMLGAGVGQIMKSMWVG